MLLKTGLLLTGKRFIKINTPGAMINRNEKSLYKSYKDESGRYFINAFLKQLC